MANNSTLGNAKVAKKDEFYTRLADINIEIQAYLDYDPDVFRGKTLLLPCDDPEWSNFTRFFALNFQKFGLKKLISTSYAPDSKAAKYGLQPSLFPDEENDPKFDKDKWQDYLKSVPAENQRGFATFLEMYGGNPYQRLIDCAKMAQKKGVIRPD